MVATAQLVLTIGTDNDTDGTAGAHRPIDEEREDRGIMTDHATMTDGGRLLGAADIRRIAEEEGISPTKKFGQNFVIDPGTVRRIVREAGVGADDTVLEVGPGLGSLTLAILETGATLTAVEIDPPLARRLPTTVAEFMPQASDRLTVITSDTIEDLNVARKFTRDGQRMYHTLLDGCVRISTPGDGTYEVLTEKDRSTDLFDET